ncbi:MAG: branched-chain amino acid aminotransferase [Caulobacteraceae bacterium]|nr:branched-chain amino acid aminotransferase [Caulobacteraceae bacterium]
MSAVVSTAQPISATWTFFEGEWHEGNVAIMGPRTHGAWLCSSVFDGGRIYEGTSPDLDLHLARVNDSARRFLLKPVVSEAAWMDLVRDGVRRFAPDTPLYVRPMYWADVGLGGGVKFDPESTRWCLCLYESPMPGAREIAITLSPFRRPTMETAPVDAKAGCLYPNNARALFEAAARGFDNCLLPDMLGNIAELANSNIFFAKDGIVFTPAPNGTFLNGITRRRVIGLLREAGRTVVEASLTYADFLDADEIFSAGNFAKVAAITRIDDRAMQPGPVFRQASALYRDFAHASSVLARAG